MVIRPFPDFPLTKQENDIFSDERSFSSGLLKCSQKSRGIGDRGTYRGNGIFADGLSFRLFELPMGPKFSVAPGDDAQACADIAYARLI